MAHSPFTIAPMRSRAGMFVSDTALMVAISHAIENVVLEHQLPVELYAGFQYVSKFVQQHERYQRLSTICRHIYIWGVPDLPPPPIPNITFLPLNDQMELSREWFVVVNTPEFFTALLAQEKTTATDTERRFEGVWTQDAELIDQVAEMIDQMLHRTHHVISDRNYESQLFYQNQMFSHMMRYRDHQRSTNGDLHLELLLQTGLAGSETPVLLLDTRKHVLAASDPACVLLRETRTEIIGKPLEQIGHGIFTQRDPTRVEAPLKTLLHVKQNYVLAASNQPIFERESNQIIGWIIRLHTADHRPVRVARRTLPIDAVLEPHSYHLKAYLQEIAATTVQAGLTIPAIEQAQHEIADLVSRINRLMLLHRIDSQGDVGFAKVDVEAVVRNTFNEYYLLARRYGVILQLEVAEHLPALLGKTAQIELALRELISNVLHHAPNSGPARVQAYHDENYFYISVQSRGPGLSQSDRERIFQPFAMQETPLDPEKRIGLGLVLARAVAQAHRGHLRIESSPNEGCAFTMMLPIASVL
ncbi:MAG: hypothetical protein HC914_18630 [Chloroflexaceae bacterium]|nr:hypothetical protein [Chloroflexaceae bacterium]